MTIYSRGRPALRDPCTSAGRGRPGAATGWCGPRSGSSRPRQAVLTSLPTHEPARPAVVPRVFAESASGVFIRIYNLFNVIIPSGEHGFRKPDNRLFNKYLLRLSVSPRKAVFVGNDIFRDIKGEKSIGMKTVLL